MNTLFENYLYHKNKPSDINEHMETLYQYSRKCDHITEMGVRTVVSTWAFLAAHPKRVVSIDIAPCDVDKAKQLAQKEMVDFEFRLGDTSSPDLVIEETDLLFIDTWHIYDQLKVELSLYPSKVRKYIILHDTTMFADVGEAWEYTDKFPKTGPNRKGLWPAIEEFLAENKEWVLEKRFTHNNGLTVLARV